ncbi:MAG: hypothetical protein LQ348_003488 [Seirophora lacunosa]|nr:MAG: hypothetical protein LQ348_003488 [Seirophora lacunosa]
MPAKSSLHDKASSLVPDLGAKPSTIVVAVLNASKDPNGSLQQDDFLWVKCHAKISLRKISEQYQLKRDSKTPWALKHDGQLINLDLTVGELNKLANNLVVLQVDDASPAGASPASIAPSTKTENSLLPKDPNPRVRPTPVPAKPLSPNNNGENAPLALSPTPDSTDDHRTPPIGIQPRHLAAKPPGQSSFPQAVSTPPRWSPLPSPHVNQPQRQSFASSAAPQAWVKVDLGGFPDYRDAWIEHYRAKYPMGTDGTSCTLLLFDISADVGVDQHSTALWSAWLKLSESDRRAWSRSPSSAPIKKESTQGSIAQSPSSQLQATNSASPKPESIAEVDDQGQKHFQLSSMLKDASPQLLESSVDASVQLLDTLRAPLADKMVNSPDAEHWIQAIDNLKKQAVKTKTVIGVVGNTGAGKSSVMYVMRDAPIFEATLTQALIQ